MPSSLLMLLDDIASVLDDVATMTKVAAKKTAGVLGDDLAVNAKQVSGVRPSRELSVVWRVAVGSAVNKAILVPAAVVLGWIAPWAVTPLLLAGALYLCYEGAEKLLHGLPRAGDHAGELERDHGRAAPDAVENAKVAAAVRTDFILSAEIIVITLGVVAGRPLATQLAVLLAIAASMTIGVYGLVAAIVKLDDAGSLLATRSHPLVAAIGRGILATAPWMMRGLSIIGTAAMFLVGGGIIAHGIPMVHDAVHDLAARISGGGHASVRAAAVATAAEATIGLGAGFVAVAVSAAVRRLGRRQGPFSDPRAGRPG